MQPSVDQLKAALSALPTSDRAELAQFLLTSLDEEPAEDVSAAWHDELNRRVAEIRSGQVAGIPLESVVHELRERYP